MKNIAITVATISTLSSVSATAQSLPDNMYIDGYIEISRVHSSSLDDTFGVASLNFGLTPTRGDGLGVGFSLGVESIQFNDAGVNELVIYPAVTVALGEAGLLSVGVPRPVLDYGYLPTDTLSYSSIMKAALDNNGISPSTAASIYLYNFVGKANIYGLRYDGEFGNTKIGASYHRIDISGGDANAYSLALQHKLGAIGSLPDTKLFGGIERLTSGGTKITSYSLGAEASSDKFRTGVIYSKNGFVNVDSANVYVDYNISDRFSVAGSYSYFDLPGGREAFGLGAKYQFLNGGYAKASYMDQDLLGRDPMYEVSLGWHF